MKLYLEILDNKFPLLDLIAGKSRFNESNISGLINKFQVRNIHNADVILIAHDAMHFAQEKKIIGFVSKIAESKPVFIFDCGDKPVNLKIPNVFSLRNNFPPGQQVQNAISIPYNVKSRSHLPTRELNVKPIVSFVGYVPKILSRRLVPRNLNEFFHPIINNGSIIRNLGLRQLHKNKHNTILISRDHYGGARSLIEDLTKFENEYEQSIMNSDLVFAPRGDANQSARFFEILSAGRVPILPDTSIRMPTIFMSDTNFVSILVNASSNNINEKISEFWEQMDEEIWREIQFKNKLVFEKCYSYPKFLNTLFSFDFSELKENIIIANNLQEGILSEK